MTASLGFASAHGDTVPDRAAVSVSARLDSLPSAALIWMLVVLLSLGSFCEIYDISLSSAFSPGLVWTVGISFMSPATGADRPKIVALHQDCSSAIRQSAADGFALGQPVPGAIAGGSAA